MVMRLGVPRLLQVVVGSLTYTVQLWRKSSPSLATVFHKGGLQGAGGQGWL